MNLISGGISGSGANIATSLIGNISPGSNEAVSLFNKFERKNKNTRYNFDIRDANLQSSTYNKIIPEVFGKVRIAGNVIWSSPIFKTQITKPVQRDKMGNITEQGSVSISYKVSIAIGICKGVIDKIENIYADDILLNQNNLDIAIYNGTEEQLPNSVIQSFEGSENTPAFRGMCYVVFNNFALDQYSGRIPNFTFDIVRYNLLVATSQKVNEMIKGINLIPGSGEFVYDTVIQYKMEPIYSGGFIVGHKKGEPINHNNNTQDSDAIASINQMLEALPNLEYISIIVCWFGSSLDIKDCIIEPKVEHKDITTTPDSWQVAGHNRNTANVVGLDEESKIRYGGTPSDTSIMRIIEYIKSKGKKVILYPMLMMDVDGKPWRGELSGDYKYVEDFFSKSNGYNNFILHYANLAKGKVDGLIIGSEFIGLTKIHNNALQSRNFPAVNALSNLATNVKKILGDGVLTTYAADWSEYHHTDEGWYNLDTLWANPAINVVGIDAYFSLTESTTSVYDVETIKKGWESDEDYEFYYTDAERTQKYNFDMNDISSYKWGIKNISTWWQNSHINPDGLETQWKSKMKKIWFTEYGFPSTDCATNQPNVFFSPGTQNSAFPRYSKGNVDFLAQRAAIIATEEKWRNSDMVVQKLLWTWDARPYPFFPNKNNLWSDSIAWQYGHWVNGKIIFSALRDVIAYLCIQSGMNYTDFDVSDIDDSIDGLVLSQKINAIQAITMLAEVYSFDIYFSNGKIIFNKLNNDLIQDIDPNDIIVMGDKVALENIKLSNIPDNIEMLYIDHQTNRPNTITIHVSEGVKKYSLNVPISMHTQVAQNKAAQIINNIFLSQDVYTIVLPLKYLYLKIGDPIRINLHSTIKFLRIVQMHLDSTQNAISILAHSSNFQNTHQVKTIAPPLSTEQKIISQTEIHPYEVPMFQGKDKSVVTLTCSVNAIHQNWSGVDVYYSVDGEDIQLAATTNIQSVTGKVVQSMHNGLTQNMIDYSSILTVTLDDYSQILPIDAEEIGSKNLAIVGNEIISFKNVVDKGNGVYEFSNILRGMFSTSTFGHAVNEKFFLLDYETLKISLPLSTIGKNVKLTAISYGDTEENATFAYIVPKGAKILPQKISNVSQIKQQNGDIMLSWFPDTGDNVDFWNSIPKTQNYELQIIDSNIIRAIYIIQSTIFVMSNSEQIRLFGTSMNSIQFNVYEKY